MAQLQVPRLNPERLRRLITAFRRPTILVVGDVMLDEFIWGQVNRISPEAPVPVVWMQAESVMPGGAANVANNIRSLGGNVQLAGIIGTDRWGDILAQTLAKRGIGTQGLIRESSSPTTVKTRVIAHHQQVVRVDRESRTPPSPTMIKRVVACVRKQSDAVDGIIIEDYGKGLITRELLQQVVPLIRSRRKIITVDPKEEHLDLYQEVTAITPNRSEAGAMVGRELATEGDLRKAGQELLRRLRCEAVVITLGEDGMFVMEQRGRCTRIPTVAQEVFDVAGAGDTVIAAFTLALASGASMPEAAILANYAAGIVVGKLGVATVSPDELSAKLDGTMPIRNAELRMRNEKIRLRTGRKRR